MSHPKRLSVVVVVFEMQREAPRTLHSLSAAYQRGIDSEAYEVIVVENGSRKPLALDDVRALPGEFRYFYLDRASASPAPAVNFGLERARGDVVCVMIDGARIATPGLLALGLDATSLDPKAVVATLGWYLGNDYQKCSVARGYDAAQEDALLASIAWPEDGYRLFEIATMDEASVGGWTGPIAESNALFLHRAMWDALGGMDERFDLPGGGLVNADTLCRACELDGSLLVVLLGEGTFHQVHGGVATNAPLTGWQARVRQYREQYEQLRGRPLAATPGHPLLLGTLPEPFLQKLVALTQHPQQSPADAQLDALRSLGLVSD